MERNIIEGLYHSMDNVIKEATMIDIVDAVEKFMVANGQTIYALNGEQACLYLDLIEEEYEELFDSTTSADELDALVDLMWVLTGYALSNGYDIKGAIKEVYKSNMSKMGADGKPILREDGKILKSENYFPPNLVPFILGERDE